MKSFKSEITRAVDIYRQELNIINLEESLLDSKKESAFERFIERCKDINEELYECLKADWW